MNKTDKKDKRKLLCIWLFIAVVMVSSLFIFVVGIGTFYYGNNEKVNYLNAEVNNINNEQDDVVQYIAKLNAKLKNNEISLDEGYNLINNLFKIDNTLLDMKYVDNLNTGWVKVENNSVDEYTFYFNNCMVSRIRYVEYVDENQNILDSEYANSSNVIKTYKYEEEYRVVGENGLSYTENQIYNTIKYDTESGSYKYVGEMKYYNVEDYVTFGDSGDYSVCEIADCTGCINCIKDWTRCISKAIEDVLATGGVLYFPTREYLVDLDDDTGLEYEILPDGRRSSFDAKKSLNNRGIGIRLHGNYITYTDNNIDNPKGFAPIILDLCGSKIKLEKNHLPNYNIIDVKNCKYVEIKNGIVQGDRMEHDYTEFLYDGVNIHPQSGDAGDHTQGYGITVLSTESAIISNMDVYDATADAVALRESVLWVNGNRVGNETSVEVKYSYLHHSRRQGITISDISNVNIHHTEIAYIGDINIMNSDGTYSLVYGWASEEDEAKYGANLTEEEKNMVATLGVGRSPMAGIDIEPDSHSAYFQAENIVINNTYIHTTFGFSIVGVGCSHSHHTTGDLTISNSFIEGFICLSENQDEYRNGVFYPAEKIVLRNNILIHAKPVIQIGYELDDRMQGEIDIWHALETTKLTYSQCIIRKTYKGHMSFFNIGNTYDGCLIEQDKDSIIYLNNPPKDTFTPNGYFWFAEGNNIINTTFRNIIGSQVNCTYWYAHGVVFRDNGLAENYGNTFDNCSVIFNQGTTGSLEGDELTDPAQTTNFIGGRVDVYSDGKTIFNNCAFVESETRALTKYLELNYCVMLNTATIFGDWNGDARAERYINNCYFQFDNEDMFASRLNRGTHWGGVWKNSVLRIEEDVNVSNAICKYSGETKAHPHFTFMSMTDLDDIDLTQISLNLEMATKSDLLFRNNNYSTEETIHSGSHDYKGLCFYESDEWLSYVKEQANANENKIYLLAYNTMVANGYYN